MHAVQAVVGTRIVSNDEYAGEGSAVKYAGV